VEQFREAWCLRQRFVGGVHVGEGAHIGLGASVRQGIKIGRNAIVGAGAVVIEDVPEDVTVVGVPAMVLGGYFSDRVSRILRGGRMPFTSTVAIVSVPLFEGKYFSTVRQPERSV